MITIILVKVLSLGCDDASVFCNVFEYQEHQKIVVLLMFLRNTKNQKVPNLANEMDGPTFFFYCML